MTNSNSPLYTIRLANQTGDDQLIAELFRKFPNQGPRLMEEGPSPSTQETLVVFDENRLVGTCTLTLCEQTDEPMPTHLVVSNLCVASPQVEEQLRFFILHLPQYKRVCPETFASFNGGYSLDEILSIWQVLINPPSN